MGVFSKDAYVKIVAVNGNFKYGYIQTVQEKGYHLLICLHEEGTSAFEYELASGAMAEEWDKMLSDIEKKIIPLLAQGLSTKEVAAKLSLSPITIRVHLRTLRLKLQMENRQQLIAFAQGINQHLEGATDMEDKND